MINNWILDIKKEADLYNESNCSFAYSITTNPSGFEHYVYVNTVCADDLSPDDFIPENKFGHIIDLRVNNNCTETFDIKLTVYISVNGTVKEFNKSFLYNPSILSDYTYNKERFNKMINGNVSYQLLRTNPKLTGNVKVVVTEDSKLYLDTFKVSLALSQYKYRHVALNPETYYGRSLMTVFHKMSTDDFYKVEDNCFNMFTAVNDYKLQYYDIYNSGVRTNSDRLYKENYALLSPLCVKWVLPDFFLIFKVNTDEFNKKKNMSELDKIKYFFANGKLVRSYDMREESNLGKYIRKIRQYATEYPGDIFVSYDNTNYNKFIGISLDRGVTTSAYESLYKENNINNQVAYNEYYTEGFQRNRLVSKDIINFEFMFNDKSENLFSINTYFGIYVKLNGEKNTFSCIGHNDVYEFNTDNLHNFPSGTDLASEYPDIIYGISTPKEFIRLKESIYDTSIMENYKLRPYKNIINGKYHNISEDSDYEYITITLNDKVKPGEHYRIIDLKHATIYNVIVSDYDKYIDEHGISEVTYNYIWHKKIRFTIKNVSAVFDDENQTQTLFYAFNKLTNMELSYDKTLVIKSYDKNLIFEKISSYSDYSGNKSDIIKNYTDEDKNIMFFDSFYPEKTIIYSENLQDNDYFYLYPFYTEATGTRIAFVCNFVKISKTGFKHTVQSDFIKSLNGDTILYRDANKAVKIYKGFDIEYIASENNSIVNKLKTVYYLISPLLDNNYIINVNEPEIYNEKFSFYSPYPINSGICSILPIKDFNFEVLDPESKIDYFKDNTKIIGDSGEFTKNSVFEDTGISFKQEEYIVDYFDKVRSYKDGLYDSSAKYTGLKDKEDKNTYYSNLIKDNHIYSDISLISPYLCKWESNGTDARGKNMRIMYTFNPHILKNTLSYYVPYTYNDGNYTEYLGYLQTNTVNKSEKYINKSFTGMIPGKTVDTGISIRDGILSGRLSIDDIIYTDISHCNKLSRVYKSGDNTIEFISGGIKFKIHSDNDDILNFNTYGAYQAIFVSVPGHNSAHSKQMELIIDEVNEQLILLYYQNINDIEIGSTLEKELSYEIPYQYSIQKSKCVDINGNTCLKSPVSTDERILKCDRHGYYLLENEYIYDSSEYTKRNNVILISDIDPDSDFTYETEPGFTITKNPVIYYGQNIDNVTNQLINNNADLYHDAVKSYIITDNVLYDTRERKNISNLQNDVKSYSVYIRKNEGAKDYTGINNLLDIKVVLPYFLKKTEIEKVVEDNQIIDTSIESTGFVQTTYGKPQMRDVVDFTYSNSELNNIFGYIFDGMNIRISNVQFVQRWINKYTDSVNYCIPINGIYPRLSLDYINNISILDNCWNDIYRKYEVDENNTDELERYDKIMGYETGYEINRFLHSRGVNLNGIEGNTIEISQWKNTKVSEREKYIKLDITESLIYNILFTKGYSESWKYLNLRSNTYKIKYIKNTILPLLNIDNNCVFSLYKFDNTKKLLFRDLNISSENIIKVDNVKHELRYENSKYYMYIYPTELCTYYAKMLIKL